MEGGHKIAISLSFFKPLLLFLVIQNEEKQREFYIEVKTVSLN